MILDGPLNPLEAVEKTQTLIEREPVAFVAALFAVAFMVSLWLLLKTKDRHLITQERAATIHAEAIAEIQKEHADKIDRLREAEHERAIKLEIVLHGILEVTDDIRYLAFQSRERTARRARSSDKPPDTGENKLP